MFKIRKFCNILKYHKTHMVIRTIIFRCIVTVRGRLRLLKGFSSLFGFFSGIGNSNLKSRTFADPLLQYLSMIIVSLRWSLNLTVCLLRSFMQTYKNWISKNFDKICLRQNLHCYLAAKVQIKFMLRHCFSKNTWRNSGFWSLFR